MNTKNQNENNSSKKINALKLAFPKGGGAIQGIGETFQTDEFTGTAGSSIPIPVSPCRGFEPDLTLAYGSGSGNGTFGLGFGLSIPSISRQTAKGIPQYNGTDTFLFGGEYLVPTLDGNGDICTELKTLNGTSYTVTTYRPRIEGQFAKIERCLIK